MSADFQYLLLCDSEVEDASELVRRVFDEFVASQYSLAGQEEFRRHASADALRERHRAGCLTFAAKRDGRLIGMLHLVDGNHIQLLFVERFSQRQGVGRRLIEAAREYALARQPSARILTVGASPNAIDAYRRMGFVPVGHEQVLKGIRYIPMELEIGCRTSAPVMIPPLEPPDSFHLSAAQGWLELGNPLEANEELERIAPQLRAHPDVLLVRWDIYARAKKWEACVDIAGTMIKLDPNRPAAWIHRSFALHELKRTQEAFDQLLPVAERFPSVWTIPYNLACYCAQLGRLEECEKWFRKAMAIDEQTVKRAGIDDPDLKPLWDSISGSLDRGTG